MWCAVTTIVVLTFIGAGTAAQPKTTAEGVFTLSQATRGEAVFRELCVSCHPLTNGMTASLSGAAFISRWRNHTVDQLLERVSLTMPENAPTSLSRQAAVDVTAYLLHINGAPAGAIELPADADKFPHVRIDWVSDGNSN